MAGDYEDSFDKPLKILWVMLKHECTRAASFGDI
jgi:hypothetical protein